MRTNTILMGIAILLAPQVVCAYDALQTPQKEENPTIEFADTLSLEEITVKANFSPANRTALRLKTITAEEIRLQSAARTYPEMLKGIPGLYATSESGSYGDAKLNIRGFGQENISVMLNGIPISGLVSGSMYWNNWMGLADATNSIQVQKGVGSSLLSDGSVGGSINIITDAPAERFKAEAGLYGSHFGTFKGYLKINSGQLRNGWSFNLMASYVGGDGYVECTKVNSFAYMLSIAKRFRNNHTLLFTALGSPEEHEQRSTRLSAAEVEQYGIKYSKNWGYRDGKPFNLSLNNYFKPYFTLQHIWSGTKVEMKNSFYLAIASGGGRWNETKGKSLSSYLKEGHIDWESALSNNRNPDGSAQNIITKYMAGHTQAGLISSAEYKISAKWRIGGGLHGQIYRTWEKERITDLLGADYWYEDYASKSLAGLAGRDPYKVEGDYVRTHNGKKILHGTLYLSAEYSGERVNLNFGASLFGSTIQRWDRYNYIGEDVNSSTAKGTGGSIKGGILLHLSKADKLYANVGWYSRLPYSSVWFASGNNSITKGVKNEKNLLGEAGWRKVWSGGGLELSGYAAYWKNKSLMSNKYKAEDAEAVRYMITGLNALHIGLEATLKQKFGRVAELETFASLGRWRWLNNVEGIIYDNYTNMEIQKVSIYSDGLPVADAPQTQLGANLKFNLPAGFMLGLDWKFNDRIYAYFDPSTRNNPNDTAVPYQYPSYHLFGGSLWWNGNICGVKVSLYAIGENLFDKLYIERGNDGADHTLETFRGYWGAGRRFTFGTKIYF